MCNTVGAAEIRTICNRGTADKKKLWVTHSRRSIDKSYSMFNVVATELKMICNKGLCSSHLKRFCNSRYSRSKNYLPPFFLHLSQSPFVIFLPYIGFLRTKKFFSLQALAICFSLPLNSS